MGKSHVVINRKFCYNLYMITEVDDKWINRFLLR